MVEIGETINVAILIALVVLTWVLPRRFGWPGLIGVHLLVVLAWMAMACIALTFGIWDYYRGLLNAIGIVVQAFLFNCILLPLALTAIRRRRRSLALRTGVEQDRSCRSLTDRILWSVLGVLAVSLLAIVAHESRNGFPFNHIGGVIGITFVSLTYLGLLLRWGPIVPCMLLGMFVFMLLTPTFATSHEEAVFNLFGMPLIGAICGSLLGFVLEYRRAHPSNAKEDQVKEESAP